MRRGAALLAVLVAVTALAACRTPGGPGGGGPGHGGGPGGLGTGDGWVDRREWRAAEDGYLAFATEELTPSSPTNVLAHLTRAERDRRFAFDADAIGPDDFAAVFDKIDAFRDTSDFDLLQLVALWEGHRDDLAPDLRTAIEQRFTTFRYWYTDPLPAGVVDDKWFWSENHRIIFHTLEYLAGRALPDATFTVTGEPGRTHADRGRARIEAWLDEKAAYGFSEWHSDVYYQEDIQALTLLAEHGERDLARRAAAMLDVFLYDLAAAPAAGQQRGHPRPVVHEGQEPGHRPGRVRADQAAVRHVRPAVPVPVRHRRHLPRRRRAATGCPRSIRRVATHRAHVRGPRRTWACRSTSTSPSPTAPVSQVPGVGYDDPAAIPFWWERGALTAWQTVPVTLATIEQHDLFETSLFRPFQPLVDIAGGDPAVARQLAHAACGA